MNSNVYEYKGAIHIHTKLSDGTGSLKTVVKSAKKAGLDWVIVTDHNYYDNEEGIINGIYVIKGEEISPPKSNHYLVLGLDKTIEPNDNPQVYVDEVRKNGYFGFAAHPDEGITVDKEGNLIPRKNSNHCIPWDNKEVKPDGVEIWNWFSNWADNLDDSNIFSLAYAYLFKHNIIKSPSKITLDWWDKLNNEFSNIIPAIGGVDAHALKFYRYIVPVTVFPYETCFKTVTNMINLSQKLSDDFQTGKEQILNAIRQGHNTIINRHVSKYLPKIYITDYKNVYYCGSDIELSEQCCLHFESKNIMKVCLIYNGLEQEIYTADKFVYPITKSGKYRIEVYDKGQSYIYTNPFNVKGKANQ